MATSKAMRELVEAIMRRADDAGLPEAAHRYSHTAPIDPEYHAPLHDLAGKQYGTYPADIYSPNAMRLYGHGDPQLDRESFDVMRRVAGNPDAQVDVYRAVPPYAPDEMIPGDWVTPNKQYAMQHGEGLGDYKILHGTTEARRLRTDGNSPHEFGYTGALSGVGVGGAGALAGVAPQGAEAMTMMGQDAYMDAPEHPRIAQLAQVLAGINRRMDNRGLGILAPEGLQEYLQKLAYDQEKLNYGDRVKAALDVAP